MQAYLKAHWKFFIALSCGYLLTFNYTCSIMAAAMGITKELLLAALRCVVQAAVLCKNKQNPLPSEFSLYMFVFLAH